MACFECGMTLWYITYVLHLVYVICVVLMAWYVAYLEIHIWMKWLSWNNWEGGEFNAHPCHIFDQWLRFVGIFCWWWRLHAPHGSFPRFYITIDLQNCVFAFDFTILFVVAISVTDFWLSSPCAWSNSLNEFCIVRFKLIYVIDLENKEGSHVLDYVFVLGI